MPEADYSGNATLQALEGADNYHRFIASLIVELCESAGAKEVLDFGAGIGTYPREARQRGYAVRCVELDDAQRAGLEADGFDAVRSLDDLPDGGCRAVYSFNVLEHIAEDVEALRELRRVTEPGGHLLLIVPAFPVLFSALDREVGHFRRYRRRELLDKVTAAGWVPDRWTYADSLGFPAALAYRLAGPLTTGVLKPTGVGVYDRVLFPLSLRLDRVAGRLFGKNLVVFAHRPG